MADKDKAKRSLFGRVVDAHTSGKLRRLTSSHSLVPGAAENSVEVSPQTSPVLGGHGAGRKAAQSSKTAINTPSRKRNDMDNMSDSVKTEMTHLLLDAVSKCSRQKMRFILMTLRRLGGVDGYMSYADFAKILQENGLSIPPTASGMLLTTCSDHLGVDSEKVWKLLMDVHGQSDRDSVRARKSLHMRTPVISVFADPGGDRELLERIETEMLAAGAVEGATTFDLDTFKTAVLALDKTRRGQVPNTQLLKTCRDCGFPAKGDLLKSLLIRCDDDNSGKISHREFFVLIDKAMDGALKVNPRLFHKKEETPIKKKMDAGRLLEDGVVTNMSPTASASPRNSNTALVEEDETGGAGHGSPEFTEAALAAQNGGAQLSLLGLPDEQATGKGKNRMMGRMKGFLGRKKGGPSSSNPMDPGSSSVDLKSASGDTMSVASSVYSSASRATGYSRDLTANGLAEKPINPVVRKVADHKLVLWPPDEYFDSVTPKIRLPSLDWVYGYSGFAHRNNIHLLAGSSSLVYFVGFLVVIYDLNTEKQRVYTEHDGLFSDGSKVATGQAGISRGAANVTSGSSTSNESVVACIRIWSTDSLTTLHIIKTGAGTNSSNPDAIPLPAVLNGAVVAVAFSQDNDAVIALDEGSIADAEKTAHRAGGRNKVPIRNLSVWSAETGNYVIHKPCTESTVVCGILSLKTNASKGREHAFVIYGRNLMEQWRVVSTEKRCEFVRQYVFGNIPKPSIVTSLMETAAGHLISADSDGNVIWWSDEMRPKSVLQAGNKIPIFSLCSLSSTLIMSGGRDGQISILSLQITGQNAISGVKPDMSHESKAETTIIRAKIKIPEEYGGVRILLPLVDGGVTPVENISSDPEKENSETDKDETVPKTEVLPYSFIIGTTANCILNTPLLSKLTTTDAPDPELQLLDISSKSQLTVLTAGHFDHVASLCTMTDNSSSSSTYGHSLALTAGMDGNVNCYDLQTRKTVWRMFLKESMVTAIDCYAPYVALGTSDGKLKLFQLTTPDLTQLSQANVGSGRVSSIKFSPDGSRLAVGSQDSEIYMYRFLEGDRANMSILGKFDKHDFPPIAIDWSRNPARDNHFVIHSNSYQFENFLWDAESLDYLEEAHFYRNIKWSTQSCTLGFAAITTVTGDGSQLDGTKQIASTEVSPTLDMVAAVVSLNQSGSEGTSNTDRQAQAMNVQPCNVVGLYSYPNANVVAVQHMHRTPSTGVSAIKFVYVSNQLFLLCTHGHDGSMTQWSLN